MDSIISEIQVGSIFLPPSKKPLCTDMMLEKNILGEIAATDKNADLECKTKVHII